MDDQDKRATIDHIVTDMGNGGAYCSHCSNDLTSYIDSYHKELRKALDRGLEELWKMPDLQCPKCEYKLREGSLYVSTGGSDF